MAERTSDEVSAIARGYTFAGAAIELGVVSENDQPVPSAGVGIPLSMLNRHGLVAGATGTGKTKTLQLMAPTPADILLPGIARSALMARYGAALDRDSAREVLAAKLAAGAATAAAERRDAEGSTVGSRRSPSDPTTPTQPPSGRGRPRRLAAPRATSPSRPPQSVVEEVVSSSVFQQFARSAGREIVRSLFATARRR